MSGDSQMTKKWMFYAQPYGCDIYERNASGKGHLVANVTVPEGVDFTAVAYLLRAAPDLFNACSIALGHLTGGMDGEWHNCKPEEVLRAAISKASYNKDEDVSHVKG